MANSSLATYTHITANRTSPREAKIDTIAIHCMVAQWTAKRCADYFCDLAEQGKQASSNYCVGYDGSIAVSVPESDRSWCTSSRAVDKRAITIEVASDTKSPYAVKDAAYNALIKLCVDICKRNGIKKLVWSNNKTDRINWKNGCNMQVHRDWDDEKSCPGDYLYSKMADIAKQVNSQLETKAEQTTANVPSQDIELVAGSVLQLKSKKLYNTASAKTNVSTISGTYFAWSNIPVNGRIKITNTKSRVGINGQVTGWIDVPSGYSIIYHVVKGDTLSAIANKYDTTVGAIAKRNGITNYNLIQIGQKLHIPY